MDLHFWMVLLLLETTFITAVAGRGDSISRHKLVDVQRRPKIHGGHAVKSIQSEDGDVIDCIDIYKQPAFDHPALKNHIIQMTPSYNPKMETSEEGSSRTVTSQLWQRSGSCPKGTIPIRRLLKGENLTENYGRKKPISFRQVPQLNKNETLHVQQENHSLAMLLTMGFSYTGAKGDIKVWNPFVEYDDEYSTSQVCLKSGPYYDYESIESGWAVNPGVYGDRRTRLFAYWTVDASNKTGCFDLACPGFVQTSNEIALGAAIHPISLPGDLPYQITIYIYKDPYTGNWWVRYGDRVNIGYWPPKLFNLLRYNAETVQWGGEVYSPRVGTHPHTATAMGNGNFADNFRGNSGCVKRMRVSENSHELKFPEWVFSYADEFDCYDVFYVGDYIEDPEFYFGGPGRNYMCP